MKLWEDTGPPVGQHMELSPANYRGLETMSTSFEAMGAIGFMVDLVGQGEPRQWPAPSVTARAFLDLGVEALLGRFFQPRKTTNATAAPCC